MELKGSMTEQNLKDAFAGESQANRRYLYFAAKADVEGYNDVAAVFRSTAEGETGHAHGHLSTSRRLATRQPVCPWVILARILKPRLPVKLTSTPICTPVWPVQRAMRALTKSRIGLKPSLKLSEATPTSSRRLWTPWRHKRPTVMARGAQSLPFLFPPARSRQHCGLILSDIQNIK